jgi:hypothetical protein
MRVLIGEMLRSEAFANTCRNIGPMRFLNLLGAYMKRKMTEGHLRPADPAVTALCCMGPPAMNMLSRVVLRVPDSEMGDGAALLEADIATFLGGMRAANPPVEKVTDSLSTLADGEPERTAP